MILRAPARPPESCSCASGIVKRHAPSRRPRSPTPSRDAGPPTSLITGQLVDAKPLAPKPPIELTNLVRPAAEARMPVTSATARTRRARRQAALAQILREWEEKAPLPLFAASHEDPWSYRQRHALVCCVRSRLKSLSLVFPTPGPASE